MAVSYKDPILQSSTKTDGGMLWGPSVQCHSGMFFVEDATHASMRQHFAHTLINSHIMLMFLNFFFIPDTQQTIFQRHPTMAEAFLSQLLRVENCVQENPISGGSGECCIICLEKCGTLCERTGVVVVHFSEQPSLPFFSRVFAL